MYVIVIRLSPKTSDRFRRRPTDFFPQSGKSCKSAWLLLIAVIDWSCYTYPAITDKWPRPLYIANTYHYFISNESWYASLKSSLKFIYFFTSPRKWNKAFKIMFTNKFTYWLAKPWKYLHKLETTCMILGPQLDNHLTTFPFVAACRCILTSASQCKCGTVKELLRDYTKICASTLRLLTITHIKLIYTIRYRYQYRYNNTDKDC